jgi:hypothetical protein
MGWVAQTNTTHDGTNAARSAPILHNQTTAMQTSVAGPGEVSFWWKVSCELEYDFVRCRLDGDEQARLSGSMDWTRRTVFIPDGRHVLEWAFSKDDGGSEGYDAAWVDEVVFVPDLGPPWVWTEPESQSVIEGDPVRLKVVARGRGPLAYQWEKDGAPVPGATNAVLRFSSARPADAGAYRVVIRNALGATNSLVVAVAVSPVVPLADALDTTGWAWTTQGAAPWFGQTEVTHDGVDAARSGRIPDHGDSILRTTVTGPGMLHFWWKASGAWDEYLAFRREGVTVDQIAGETDWEERSLFVPSGPQTIEWLYWQDDDTGDEGIGWVDQVSFVPDTGPPVILTHPQSLTVTQGMAAVLEVSVRGQWPFNYQWLRDGTNLTGGTNSSLVISNAQGADAGQYQVRVSNTVGSVLSSNATLQVIWFCGLGDALDATALPWTTDALRPWQCQTNISHDGVSAARSGSVADSQTSFLETTVSGPGELRFWWKVSSEPIFDFLAFAVDGTTIEQVSGEVDWQEVVVPLPEGSHALRWTYDKDSGFSEGQDAAWVDAVIFQPSGLPYRTKLRP